MTKLWVNDVEHDFVEREEIEGMVRKILETERETILVEIANKAMMELAKKDEQLNHLSEQLAEQMVTKVVQEPSKQKREGFFKEFKGVLQKSFSNKEQK